MDATDPAKILARWGATLKGEWQARTSEEETTLRERIRMVEGHIETLQDPDSWEKQVEELSSALDSWKGRYDKLEGELRDLDDVLGELLRELARAQEEETRRGLERCAALLTEQQKRRQFQDDLDTVAAVSRFFGDDFGSLSPAQFEKEVPALRREVDTIREERQKDLEQACAKALLHAEILAQNEELLQRREALTGEIAAHGEYLATRHLVTGEVLDSLKALQPHQKEDLLNTVIKPKARDATLEKEWQVPNDVMKTERQKWN